MDLSAIWQAITGAINALMSGSSVTGGGTAGNAGSSGGGTGGPSGSSFGGTTNTGSM